MIAFMGSYQKGDKESLLSWYKYQLLAVIFTPAVLPPVSSLLPQLSSQAVSQSWGASEQDETAGPSSGVETSSEDVQL